MTFDEHEVLARFHRALVREIHSKDPEHINAPFTVAEIYQNLVPYRTHRAEIGVEMNADYEYALLRLLAGEGDYLTIESKTARDEIKEELDSPNPNTGLYRDFAAADVRLNPDRVEAVLQDVVDWAEPSEETGGDVQGDEETTGDDEGSVGFLDTEDDVDAFERLEVEPVGAGLAPIDEEGDSDELESRPAEAGEPEGMEDFGGEAELEDDVESTEEKEDLPPFENCPWCREKLPQQARVRFCPFCGSNVQLVPCPACGEELRLNWRFCIACGTEVQS